MSAIRTLAHSMHESAELTGKLMLVTMAYIAYKIDGKQSARQWLQLAGYKFTS